MAFARLLGLWLGCALALALGSSESENKALHKFQRLEISGSAANGIQIKVKDEDIRYEFRPRRFDGVMWSVRVYQGAQEIAREDIPNDFAAFFPNDERRFFGFPADGTSLDLAIRIQNRRGETVGEVRVYPAPIEVLAGTLFKDPGDARLAIFEGSTKDSVWQRKVPWVRVEAFLRPEVHYYVDLFSTEPNGEGDHERKIHRSWELKSEKSK